jgi:hypothetical protein
MRTTLNTIASLVACILASAALMAALTHTGPRGITGPQGGQGVAGKTGDSGPSAVSEHLGICWSSSTQSGYGLSWIDSVWIQSPQISNGVFQCANGETYVPIMPQAQPSTNG